MGIPVQSARASTSGFHNSLGLAFPSANTAGNTVVVLVGCFRGALSGTTISVADSNGNAYTAGPQPHHLSQFLAIFYASGIAAGSNTVTATITTPGGGTGDLDLIIAEYSGSLTVDQQADSGGSAGPPFTTVSSGSVTTTNPTDLIVTAGYDGDSSHSWTTSAGYTQEQVTTNPGSETLILADQSVSATGTYSNTFSFTGGASSNLFGAIVAFTAGSGPSLALDLDSPPDGYLGSAYSHSVIASFGATPYTAYAVTVGSLPAGLSIDSAGVISGTPTAAGTFSFTIQVTDSASNTASASGSIIVHAITIDSSSTLPNAGLQADYCYQITVLGSLGATTYTVVSGSLPPRLSLSASGRFSGTATRLGAYPFDVQADDGTNTTTKSFTLTVALYARTDTLVPDTVIYGSDSGAEINPSATSILAADLFFRCGRTFTIVTETVANTLPNPSTLGTIVCLSSSNGEWSVEDSASSPPGLAPSQTPDWAFFDLTGQPLTANMALAKSGDYVYCLSVASLTNGFLRDPEDPETADLDSRNVYQWDYAVGDFRNSPGGSTPGDPTAYQLGDVPPYRRAFGEHSPVGNARYYPFPGTSAAYGMNCQSGHRVTIALHAFHLLSRQWLDITPLSPFAHPVMFDLGWCDDGGIRDAHDFSLIRTQSSVFCIAVRPNRDLLILYRDVPALGVVNPPGNRYYNQNANFHNSTQLTLIVLPSQSPSTSAPVYDWAFSTKYSVSDGLDCYAHQTIAGRNGFYAICGQAPFQASGTPSPTNPSLVSYYVRYVPHSGAIGGGVGLPYDPYLWYGPSALPEDSDGGSTGTFPYQTIAGNMGQGLSFQDKDGIWKIAIPAMGPGKEVQILIGADNGLCSFSVETIVGGAECYLAYGRVCGYTAVSAAIIGCDLHVFWASAYYNPPIHPYTLRMKFSKRTGVGTWSSPAFFDGFGNDVYSKLQDGVAVRRDPYTGRMAMLNIFDAANAPPHYYQPLTSPIAPCMQKQSRNHAFIGAWSLRR